MKLGKHPTNQEVARLFREVAAAYEVKSGDYFRTRAYTSAAESIDHAGADLYDLWREKALERVPGLGPNLIEHLDELFRTGRVKHFDEVMNDLPGGMFALLDLPDVGPKTAHKLATKLKLNSAETALEKLVAAVEDGDLVNVPGIGEKTIAELGRALGSLRHHPTKYRLFLSEAEAIASEVMAYLSTLPEVEAVENLGSLRRHSSTIGDIDLAIKTRRPKEVFEQLQRFPQLKRLVSSGENTAMMTHNSGRQIDLKTQPPESWGSLLQHYTGSKLHNIHLRTLAKENGYSLSEYGIKTKAGLKKFQDEESFYRFLGMDNIPPELREDGGEIEAAKTGKLPHLVEANDIRGDLHVHCNLDWPSSHDIGEDSLAALFSAAAERGYEYLGISDHQPKASGLSATDRRRYVEKRNEQIERAHEKWQRANPKKKLTVFKGLEIDIRSDGSLALEDEAIDQLDYTIVSVHSNFSESAKEATERMKRALSHPKAMIWGHPTGRKINERRGLEYDWTELFKVCAQAKILIEINASPWRLDLPDALVHTAIESDIKLVINSDSHSLSNFDFMKYGVWTARRGWAQAKDVANTLPASQLSELFRD